VFTHREALVGDVLEGRRVKQLLRQMFAKEECLAATNRGCENMRDCLALHV
jgi:hypothetical protein